MLFDLREQIAKSLQCPDCSIDMDFLASLRTNAYCIDDLRARVLSLSELPAPQPETIEPKRRDEPQRGLTCNRGPS